MPTSLNTVLSASAALGAVLALVLLAAHVARRFGLARPALPRTHKQSRLTAQACLPLDRVRTVHIVRCDGRDVALLTGGPADLLLGWLPEPPALAPQPGAAA